MLYAIVILMIFLFFFFNDTATTEIYTLSLHDALPISTSHYDHDFDNTLQKLLADECQVYAVQTGVYDNANVRSEEHTSELQSLAYLVCRLLLEKKKKNTYRVSYNAHNVVTRACA